MYHLFYKKKNREIKYSKQTAATADKCKQIIIGTCHRHSTGGPQRSRPLSAGPRMSGDPFWQI